MFDTDLDDLTTADLLAAAAEFAHDQERAAVGILRAALAFADRNAMVEREPLPGYERIQVYGGEGCPGVAEFAPIEFGAVLGMSSGAASALIGEALALRHRLPRVWAAVLGGAAVAWRARKIAHACLSLSLKAAAIVDRRVAGIVNTVTPGALKKIVTAAVWEADPDLAQAHAEAAARTRGVFVAQSDASDDHGTKRIWVRAAAGDVIRFDATIADLAQALKALGDTDDLNQRRAKAIGWIADPAAANHLIEVARHLARTQPTTPSTGASPTRADSGAVNAADTGGNAADHATHLADPAAESKASDRSDAAQATTANPIEALSDHTRDDSADKCDEVAGEVSVAGQGHDAFTRLALADSLAARLAAIKRDAYCRGLGAGTASGGRPLQRNRHTLYVHLTDKTLAAGTGVVRAEDLGPLLATQLTELLGHDQIVVKPVIDLHDQISVHSYEIPTRIRERVRLRHPVDMFPHSGAEATTRMDQDHITPYHEPASNNHARRYNHAASSAHATPFDHAAPLQRARRQSSMAPDAPPVASAPSRPPGRTTPHGRTRPPGRSGAVDRIGPPGQTSVDNLIPQGRLHHRAKTFGGWKNRRLPTGGIEWTSPHGFRFLVDHTGTHPLPRRQPAGRATDPRTGS
jgi:hypothetical protein